MALYKYRLTEPMLNLCKVQDTLRNLHNERGLAGGSRLGKTELIRGILGNSGAIEHTLVTATSPGAMAGRDGKYYDGRGMQALAASAGGDPSDARTPKGGEPSTDLGVELEELIEAPMPPTQPLPPLPEPINPVEAPPAKPGLEGALADIIGVAVSEHIGEHMKREGLTLDAVQQMVADAAMKLVMPKTLRIKKHECPDIDLGLVHPQLATTLKILKCGLHPYLLGPSGSGKSFGARQMAEALEVPLCFIGFTDDIASTVLSGSNSPFTGEYNSTKFFEAWTGTGDFEKGALILLDEIDRGPGGVVVGLNGALSGEAEFSFPCGVFPKGDNVFLVLTGNTRWNGGDATYGSAERQDGSTGNRLTFVSWDYDKGFERSLGEAFASANGVDSATAKQWMELIWAVRKAADKLQNPTIVGPRQIQDGLTLIGAGLSFAQVELLQVWNRFDPSDSKIIKSHM